MEGHHYADVLSGCPFHGFLARFKEVWRLGAEKMRVLRFPAAARAVNRDTNSH